MNKIIECCALLFLLALPVQAQSVESNKVSSPYTWFGIGEIEDKGFAVNRFMGGMGTGLYVGNQINIQNPASYSAVDTLSFLFEAGLNARFNTLESSESSISKGSSNIDYLSFLFSAANNFGINVGVSPYSSVGYNMTGAYQREGIGEVNAEYSGDGGLSRFHAGMGLQVLKNLSLGMNANYLFGKNTQYSRISLVGDDVSYSVEKTIETDIRDIYFDFGMLYRWVLNSDNVLNFGAAFNPKSPLRADRNVVKNRLGTRDTVTTNTKFNLPSELSLGLTFNSRYLWVYGADISFTYWDKSGLFNDDQPDYNFKNRTRFSVGGMYRGDPFEMSYLKRIRFSAGLYYVNSHLEVNNKQITDYGISFGVGLPLGRSLTSFNIGYEYGQRGTTANNLILEKYSRITLSLSLHEFWFIQRKFE